MGDEEVQKKHCNFRLLTVTFEPRHENKSCSACRERVNERVKVVKVVKVKECKSGRVTFEHRHENKSCSACGE